MPTSTPSKSIEHYLMTMYRLVETKGNEPLHTSELAKQLGISLASVSDMLKKLAKQKLVVHKKYQGVQLTEMGFKEASRIIRKHRLVECFLKTFLDIEPEELHAEAHEFEHVISDKVEAKLAKALKNPKTCPHGNPIPTPEGKVEPDYSKPLPTLPEQQTAEIIKFTKEDNDYINYLHSLGLHPGIKITITSIEPFGGPIYLKVGGKTCALGKEAAEHIWVK